MKRIYSPILKNIEAYIIEFNQIDNERKAALKRLALFVKSKVEACEKAELIFICTHNSRRSHISQIWAQTAAAYYDIPDVIAYSGGTEATAFNSRAVKAIEDAGFRITKTIDGKNPHYEVRFSDDGFAIEAFSKKYDSRENPGEGFGAVMTCSHADDNCPLVAGAEARVSIPYEDPKDFDETSQDAAKYAERVHQIGREIFYTFSLINLQRTKGL
jgi:arsenate reductase